MVGVEHPSHNGQMVNMDNNLNFNGCKISKDEFNSFLDTLINKVFAILAIYEDCEECNDYSMLSLYVFRVSSEIRGFSRLMNINSFISLSSIIEDMREKISLKELNKIENFGHKQVKFLVFHCISIIEKEKVL